MQSPRLSYNSNVDRGVEAAITLDCCESLADNGSKYLDSSKALNARGPPGTRAPMLCEDSAPELLTPTPAADTRRGAGEKGGEDDVGEGEPAMEL
mmetsp:Transcript_68352/g.142875  ORF Transcript_68352/g.142875 Transcript_68352/m.142875 type:complete len:95 (-) Transcript_68352:992-1276(-)|eukprot:CAMPEP_0206585832 /NCGR_PEP_ID=MMETSP0325_2-20121206/36654_1 /ASSEMBLY_ACC=CAM_ASM_000347 /TAXON_ID=2866 /ORGANISM="Crypthecodinium cohnii, Strain Seligo" /LENGTH=94 /DNA_ID=CAMNT_0054093459 /DNA_START=852 /DNA_END=1136 /DNA_ORIENTATION=-